jgi:acyl-CoA thioesterase
MRATVPAWRGRPASVIVVGVTGRPQTPFDTTDADTDALEPGDVRRDTTPHPVAGVPGRYHGFIPEAWRVMYAFGGTTMATAIRAATVEIGRADLVPVGAEATFCQAVPCGPVAAQVEVLRSGRSGAQALVRLWALDPAAPEPAGPVGNDVVVAVVLGARRPSHLSFVGAEAPEVRPPDECPGRETAGASPFHRIPYHRQTDFRIAMGNVRWGEPVDPGEPRTASWFRFNTSPLGDDGAWDPALLAVPGDVLGPAVHAGLGGKVGFFFVISLQIGLKFIADCRSEWVLQHTRAHSAADGFASGTAELFDLDRRLVAIATQTAVLRPFAADPGATDA